MDILKNAYNATVNQVQSLGGTELERKVKEATSNENWGVSSTIKNEIAQATSDYSSFGEIMQILWARIGQKNTSNWRIVFKGLDLLMFLLKNGHHRIIEETRDHMMIVRPLQDFRYTDPQTGLDKGRGIRELSKQIIELMRDSKRLDGLRRDAQKQRSKLHGINATSASSDRGYGGGGYGGGGYSGGGYNTSYNTYGGKSQSSDDRWRSDYTSKSTYDDDSEKKKKKKKKSKKDDWDDDNDDDPWGDDSEKKKKKKKHKKKHKKRDSDDDDDELDEDEEEERKHKHKHKHKKRHSKKDKHLKKMTIEPLDAPKSDATVTAIAGPPGGRGGSKKTTNNANTTADLMGGNDDAFGFGNDFAAAVPAANDDAFGFGNDDAFGAPTGAAPATNNGGDGGFGFSNNDDLFGAPTGAAPAQQGNSGGFGFDNNNDDGFGFGNTMSNNNGAAPSGGNDGFGFDMGASAQVQAQPTQAAAPSRPLTMNQRAQQAQGGGASSLFDASNSNNIDIFGSSNTQTNNQPQSSNNDFLSGLNNASTNNNTATQSNDIAVTSGVTVEESKKEEPKTNDAWELGKKFTDLSNLTSTQQKTKMVAYDPSKPKQTSGPLPSLSTYGNNKPDLAGFGGGGGMASLNNLGMGQMGQPNMNTMGTGRMSMNAMGSGMPAMSNIGGGMGMNQMGMGQMGMGQMGMGQMGMGQMGMNQMGMNQMGMGGGMGMNQMGMGMNTMGGGGGGGFMSGGMGAQPSQNRNQPTANNGGIGPFF